VGECLSSVHASIQRDRPNSSRVLVVNEDRHEEEDEIKNVL
jgi:hypothetical protein